LVFINVCPEAFLRRKKYSMPACAITSIVPKVKESAIELVPEVAVIPGLKTVGPKTVAKLCNDILLCSSN
jgi:hypothetical protein